MRRYLPGIITLICLILTSCASNRYPSQGIGMPSQNWMQEVDTNPMKWSRGADRWFFSGRANATELSVRKEPVSAAVSTMVVRVSDFANLKVAGNFQVQIFGTYGHNSVFVYGPNEGVRHVAIEMRGNILCLSQTDTEADTSKVIIRIGMRHLDSLNKLGSGSVEGIQLLSNRLNIISAGSGNIYLAGNLNLHRVINTGSGNISVYGVDTPVLGIKTTGNGAVNVGGRRVGIRLIEHHGNAHINIIGANSPGLNIRADGGGRIGINGYVNLQNVIAVGHTKVFIYFVKSDSLHVATFGQASVALAGTVQKFNLDTHQDSCFSGRELCAVEAYVKADDSSHANVSATNKIYVSSASKSSVYFFGSRTVVSEFMSGSGTVIPVWSETGSCCIQSRPPIDYKGERR